MYSLIEKAMDIQIQVAGHTFRNTVPEQMVQVREYTFANSATLTHFFSSGTTRYWPSDIKQIIVLPARVDMEMKCDSMLVC